VTSLLDASAVLALLLDEPGADVVEQHLDDGWLLSVNLTEVVTHLGRRGLTPSRVEMAIAPLAIGIVPFEEDMAWIAGELRAHLPAGLGLADCCCLAAAAARRATAVTADMLWREAAPSFGVEVVLIR
jgi:ribonuclease VapC